ncbi:hypothetical protein [Gordonia polyisoprenivorans]|uniref:hypothetical protein n=1 Tax=Gordonia polyisoprenivorans TaxID=84595 RepID=UPI001055E644|nr:hypothetical protein [Gordonia polyisoprenivorans]
MKKHRNQTVSTQTRKAKPDKNNPKNWQKNPHHTPQQGRDAQNSNATKQMASNNPPIHYRVLKEHTPTNTTPHKGEHQ